MCSKENNINKELTKGLDKLREDNSRITYYDYPNDTKIHIKSYYNICDGCCRLHNSEGPARIHYIEEDGSKFMEEYYFNNQLHRDDNPAIIWFNKNGIPTTWEYWKYGRPIKVKKENDEFGKKVNIERNLKLLNKK